MRDTLPKWTLVYPGARVLVTGHTGFKGTWLCHLLSALGAQVYGYSLPAGEGSLYTRARPRLAGECLADIRDEGRLTQVISRFQPDLIFHLAAHAYLDGSDQIPVQIFDINVMGTVRLLERVRKWGGRASVVVITSDKCYSQELRGRPCREGDPLGAAEAYSTSKACQDLAAQCYRHAFPALPIATARASNAIGGGDFHTARLVPHLLDCFSRGETARLRHPAYIRPWQYVLDVLWGYLTLGGALAEGRALPPSFNFGPAPDGFAPVERMAELLASHFPGARYERADPGEGGETEILRLESKQARELLGWRPLYRLEETVAQTAAFFRRASREPTERICLDQVEEYLARAARGEAGR